MSQPIALLPIPGGITAAKGYHAAGVHAGIKAKALDLALVKSREPASVAGVFTTNSIKGAHVGLCKKHLAGGICNAIVVNSGSANACTGPQGVADARAMADMVATAFGLKTETVFVCSTGTIGKPLPLDRIKTGIAQAVEIRATTGGGDAARAIMTTDLVPKEYAVEVHISGKPVRIGGMAKGSGMIEPNMATMLGFITSDAAVQQASLQQALVVAVNQSFNRITVDGEQSCNDTVLLTANGMSGAPMLSNTHPEWTIFQTALNQVARELAMMIAKDGEGATKFVTVTVEGAAKPADALTAARAIANSKLVKTAWFGNDPNWGRIINAVGYSGVSMDPDKVDIRFDDLLVVRAGQKAAGVELSSLEAIFAQKSFSVNVHLHSGPHHDTVYTCDLSYDYVKINADYMT